MKIDRAKFFAGYRAKFGALNQSQIDGLKILLFFIEGDTGTVNEWTDERQLAYFLATIKHECADTWHPIEEYGKGKGRAYGIPDKNGKTYYGRGYVQLTWLRNYQIFASALNVDLVNHPELAIDPAISYAIAKRGMDHGNFTGKSLCDYINATRCDLFNARRIINGIDKASLIANFATNFISILRAATI